MIGTPVSPFTPPGAPILVAHGGNVVHVGAFVSGDADGSPYGRVVVESREGTTKFDAENGYNWRVISQSTAAKIVANLDAEAKSIEQAVHLRTLVNRIAKVKP